MVEDWTSFLLMVAKADHTTQESPTRTQEASPSGVPRKQRTRDLEQLVFTPDAFELQCHYIQPKHQMTPIIPPWGANGINRASC